MSVEKEQPWHLYCDDLGHRLQRELQAAMAMWPRLLNGFERRGQELVASLNDIDIVHVRDCEYAVIAERPGPGAFSPLVDGEVRWAKKKVRLPGLPDLEWTAGVRAEGVARCTGEVRVRPVGKWGMVVANDAYEADQLNDFWLDVELPAYRLKRTMCRRDDKHIKYHYAMFYMMSYAESSF